MRKIRKKSNAFVEEAIKELGVAQESEFEDKEALKRCVNNLFQAFNADPTHSTPCCLIGYVLLLLEDTERAKQYLDVALELDPTNQDAQELVDYINGGEKGDVP